MPLLGSNYQPAKIYDLNTHDYQRPEPFRGYYTLYDDVDRMRQPLYKNPISFHYDYDDYKKSAATSISNRLKLRHNKTEYEKKMGRRPEGLQFKSAKDRPYINLQETAQNFDTPEKLGDMTDAQQYKLITVYPKINIKPSIGDMDQALNKTQVPDEIDLINVQEPLDFIKEHKGEYMTEMSNNNAIDVNGSTIKQNYAVEMNRPVKPRSGYENYVQYISNNKTISNINMRQLQNAKARQIIGLYGGSPADQSVELLRKISMGMSKPKI